MNGQLVFECVNVFLNVYSHFDVLNKIEPIHYSDC